MKTLTVKMPAFLASALVNGDTSGLSRARRSDWAGEHAAKNDFEWLQAALDYCKPGQVASAEGEAYFSWSCDLPGWGHFGADMLDYVVIYPEG